MTFRPRFEVKQLSALRHTVVKGLAKVTEGLVLMPNRHNAIYTHSHFIHGIVNAAHQNKSIGKTANTQRSKFKDIHGSPTDEWFRLRMKNMSLKEINQVLAKCMEDNIKRIKDASPELFQDWESNGMTVGIDMHLQRRYDKKAKDATDEEVDEWMEESFLNKTRYEKGTVLCNTFATISCITKRSSFFLGSIMIQKGTTKAEAVKKLLDMADELTVNQAWHY